MAISTYKELKDATIAYMRQESFVNIFDIFITSVEFEVFNNAIEILESDFLEQKLELTTVADSNEVELPAGLLEIHDIRLNGCKLQYKTVDMLHINQGSTPTEYTIYNNKIILNVVPQEISTLKVSCEIEFTPLTEINDTNILLTNNPNIYLNGCLWKAHEEEGNMEKSVYYYNQMISSIRGTNKKAYNKRYPNGLSIGFDE